MALVKTPRLHIRDVGAVGSNPITSTKSPGQGLESGSPQEPHLGRRDLIGEEIPVSTT